jgi:serine/threonine protein kinase/Tol biopolymer transport system component
MSLAAGTHLGRYEILDLLGAGGMGEVYRARDTHLHRDVALKILPETATANQAADARFEREARTIASVNHPNICAVHDAGVDAGRRFLVMELLEGEALDRRLRGGPFGVRELVEHAIELTDALHAAHSREIIHRDLKPANIFLTRHGHLKILDFGLAKATEAADAVTRAGDGAITGQGMAVGTAAYMSPEQIRGELLDGRSDIFSLGLVLYEMATGHPAFSGTTGTAAAASILNDGVRPPTQLKPDLPSEFDRTILKALEKDRDLRYQTAAELEVDLKRVKRQLTSSAIEPTPPSQWHSPSFRTRVSRRAGWVGAAAAVIVLAFAAVWLWRQSKSNANVPVVSDLQMQSLTLDGRAVLGTISPDGRFLIYRQDRGGGIRVRQVSGESDVALLPADRFSGVFSLTVTPDGNSVDIVAVTGAAEVPDVWRIPLLGGNTKQILRGVVSAIGWSPDGRTMTFVRADGPASDMAVVLADADGSNQRELVRRRRPKMFYGYFTPGLGRPPSQPAWSPDGALLVLAGYSSETQQASELVILDAKTGKERQSIQMAGSWTEVAWLDQERLLLVGSPDLGTTPLRLWVSDLAGKHPMPLSREFGSFMNLSVSADRATAVVKKYVRSSGIWESDASGHDGVVKVPMSQVGAATPLLDVDGGITYTAFRPDGTAAVYHLAPGAPAAFPIVERTAPPPAGRFCDVSSDARTIVCADARSPRGLFRVDKDGTNRVTLVDRDVDSPRLTPDGRQVLFMSGTQPGLFSIPTAGGSVTKITDRAIARRPGFSISPDGRRVLLATDTFGSVTLCDLPGCSNAQSLKLRNIEWAPDGLGVAYVQYPSTIIEQPFDGSTERVLARLQGDEPIINFRWSPDGSRLVTSRGRYPNDMMIVRRLQ